MTGTSTNFDVKKKEKYEKAFIEFLDAASALARLERIKKDCHSLIDVLELVRRGAIHEEDDIPLVMIPHLKKAQRVLIKHFDYYKEESDLRDCVEKFCYDLVLAAKAEKQAYCKFTKVFSETFGEYEDAVFPFIPTTDNAGNLAVLRDKLSEVSKNSEGYDRRKFYKNKLKTAPPDAILSPKALEMSFIISQNRILNDIFKPIE